MLVSIAGNAVTHDPDRPLVVSLPQGVQKGPVVEVAPIERLNQAVGPGLGSDLCSAERYAEQLIGVRTAGAGNPCSPRP